MARALDRTYFHWVRDPRHSDRSVGVYFRVDDPGSDPHGYGEDFDPGSDPAVEIVSVRNESGSAAVKLTDAQHEIIESQIINDFDFRAAAREERDQDAELSCLEGVL